MSAARLLRTAAIVAAFAGIVSAQVAVAVAYHNLGTWWHYLLHQMVGWGVGLAVAAVVAGTTRYRIAAVPALLAGQLFSIVPDLMFRYLRHPHEQSMDLYLGHISIHTGPSPVLVGLGCLLLGGWGYAAALLGRARAGAALGTGALLLVAVACLIAADVPHRLQDFPVDTAPLPAAGPR